MIPIAVIAVYLVAVTAAASALVRRNRDARSWTVASSRMGLGMVAAGVAGTRIGGVGTYGVAGDVMREGLWALWYGVNTFLALALVGIFFARAFRRLELQTVSEVFRQRFGSRRCQVLTSLCVQTEYLIVNILEPFVIGSIVTGLTGLPFAVSVFLGAAVLILSTTLGGLWGNAFANVIHCGTILLGLGTVVWLGFDHLGGVAAMHQQIDEVLASAQVDGRSWWSFVGAGWGAVIAMFFSATIHTPAASVYVNFASAARTERTIVPAFLLGGVIAAAMPFLAGIIGMQTLAAYGAGSGLRSYTAITQLAVEISPWLGGLALAAVLAAVISSGGPILLASATLLLRDCVPPFERLSPAKKLASLRVVTIAYGVLAAFIAWRGEIRSILDLLLFGFAMVVPPAVALGLVLYWPRTTERACFWGMASGYGGGLLWFLYGHYARAQDGALLHRAFAAETWWTDPSYLTTVLPVVLIPVLSLVGRAPEAATERRQRERFYERLRARSTSTQG